MGAWDWLPRLPAVPSAEEASRAATLAERERVLALALRLLARECSMPRTPLRRFLDAVRDGSRADSL
jgi:hypothetical protein